MPRSLPVDPGPEMSAGIVVSSHMALLLLVLFIICVCGALAIWAVVWTQHGQLKRRVRVLEEAFREDSLRGERIEDGLADLKTSMKHQQDLLNIIVREQVRRS